MDCTLCSNEISAARLKAMPGATLCISCASQNDVPCIRRYDDHTERGDVSETYYTDNPLIDAEVERLRIFNPYVVTRDGYNGPPTAEHIEYYPEDLPAHQLVLTPRLYSASRKV